MTDKKSKEVLDWYGNPLPPDKIPHAQEGIRGETGADGRKYLRTWHADGKPGKRVALEDSYLTINDDNGRVIYDFSVWPPAEAKIQPGYVGFVFEEILKGYFGESHADKQRLGKRWRDPLKNKWVETTEDGVQYWRWNVIWMDRIALTEEQQKLDALPRI